MNFENILKIITVFVTYGIPVLSFLWQIKSDFSDKKQIESIVSNYNYQNNSSFDFKDVSIQNGYIQISNPQTINIELKNELEKFDKERLEDKKFLSNKLYKASFWIILVVFIFNIINNISSDFKNISSILEVNIIKNNLVLSFDTTLKQMLLMILIYIVLVVIKYLLDKQNIINTLGFTVAIFLYLFAHSEIKQGFIQFLKYPIILSSLSVFISIIVALVVLFPLFFSLNILIARLHGLISVYDSKIQTKLINYLSSISTVIAPILIFIVKMVFR